MIILAIETSCDETAISILKISGGLKNPTFEILSNIVASQVKIHSQWGGIVPSLAKREHQANLIPVLKKAIKKSGLRLIGEHQKPNIDIIAVTQGPGLEPALWTGINFAKALAIGWNKPLIAINHMEGHIVASLLKSNLKNQISKITFPAIALLVSGGHTQLVLMNPVRNSPPAGTSGAQNAGEISNGVKYKIIGETRDDAAGEAFDKVARMLGLGYPGGPAIANYAAKSEIRNSKHETNSKLKIKNSKFTLPRPMLNSKDFNFSFSGLKTAVLYKIKELGTLNENLKAEIAAEFQQAVIDVLISKTLRAAKTYQAKTIILGGGVAANKELRKQLKLSVKKELPDSRLLLPEIKFTGDNAAMIALAAYFRAKKKELANNQQALTAKGNLRI